MGRRQVCWMLDISRLHQDGFISVRFRWERRLQSYSQSLAREPTSTGGFYSCMVLGLLVLRVTAKSAPILDRCYRNCLTPSWPGVSGMHGFRLRICRVLAEAFH